MGNKIDLERHVSREQVYRWANQHSLPYVETSALMDIGVEQAVYSMVYDIFRFIEQMGSYPVPKVLLGANYSYPRRRKRKGDFVKNDRNRNTFVSSTLDLVFKFTI